MPTVLIVDDHSAFRAAARALLEADGFNVIGEAADAVAAIHAIDVLRPNIVLVDVQLPGLDGFVLADNIARGQDPPAVVLISSRDARAYGSRLPHRSARGFLAKRDLSGKALAALAG